jgi:hypothetical protein
MQRQGGRPRHALASHTELARRLRCLGCAGSSLAVAGVCSDRSPTSTDSFSRRTPEGSLILVGQVRRMAAAPIEEVLADLETCRYHKESDCLPAAAFGSLTSVIGSTWSPTPTASDYGRDRSPSGGASIRPSLQTMARYNGSPRYPRRGRRRRGSNVTSLGTRTLRTEAAETAR